MNCLPSQIQPFVTYLNANPVVLALVALLVPAALIVVLPKLRGGGLFRVVLLFIASGAVIYTALYVLVIQLGLGC